MPHSPLLRSGFTLIELLVAITILVLLVGGGIGAYINFNERQTLRLGAQSLQTYLKTAQNKARAGDRPDGCSLLQGYRLQMASGLENVDVIALCQGGNSTTNQYLLPDGVVPTADVQVDFATLKGGVTGAGRVTLQYAGRQYSFDVGAGGEVSRGDFVE